MVWSVLAVFCGGYPELIGADSPPWNIDLVGQLGGWQLAIETDGQYAYLSEGGSILILDISRASSPCPVERLSFDDFYVLDIAIREGTAYCAGNSFAGQPGVQIADISNPGHMTVIGFYPTREVARSIHLSDSLAYVASSGAGQGGIQVLDVSNPSSPTLRGTFFESAFQTYEVYVDGSTAYVVAWDGLHILDVTNPAAPSRFGHYDRRECEDVLVSGTFAYIATDSALVIVDVSNPTTPNQRGILIGGGAHAVAIYDGLLITGFGIVDATDPSSPSLVGEFPYPRPSSVGVSSGTAYLVSERAGLSIMDVSIPSSPTLLATYDTLCNAVDVQVEDGVAYVANGYRGFKFIDVSDPQSPSILTSLPAARLASEIAVSGEIGYLSDVYESLQIVDLASPSLPIVLGSYDTPEYDIEDIAVTGGLAYMPFIGGGETGLKIVDVNDPASPSLRASLNTEVWASDVFVTDNLAFVADYSTVQIIDVTDPSSPFVRSTFPADQWRRINDVFVVDGIAYLTGVRALNTDNFACVDVSNPDAPVLLGTYDLQGYEDETRGLYVSNGLAYAIYDELRVIDVSDPSSPTLCGHYPTRRSPFGSDLFVYDGLVYVADFAGLRIFRYTGVVAAARPVWPLYK